MWKKLSLQITLVLVFLIIVFFASNVYLLLQIERLKSINQDIENTAQEMVRLPAGRDISKLQVLLATQESNY